MKRVLGLITVFVFGWTWLQAMTYEEARDRARFLTDKMAYELNLNDQQYNDAYEINLDYLMNIQTASNVSGNNLEYRNADLRFILYDWQYDLFQAASYFFRPVLWKAGGWFLPVFIIYTPGRFYYNPPTVYNIYRGGHFRYWNEHRTSFYVNRRPAWHGGLRGDSRGPIAGRPTPPIHQPTPPHNIGGAGFHFSPVKRPSAPPTTRPNNGGNGFHFEPVKPNNPPQQNRPATRPGQTTTTRPTDSGLRPSTTGQTKPTPNRVTRPVTPTGPQPSGTNTPARPTRVERPSMNQQNSHYYRPSSTRTTVNQTLPKRPQTTNARPQTTPRVQNTARIQRSSVRPSFSNKAPSPASRTAPEVGRCPRR
ncbi:MAG: hypothetical protein LUC45_05885 [Paraprevotella sp.]|nr:hypothetical protein [Paraprevotella sp.]